MRSSPGVQALSLPGLQCLVFLNLPFASSSCKCFLGPHEKSAKYNLPMPTTNQSSEHHLFHVYHIALAGSLIALGTVRGVMIFASIS